MGLRADEPAPAAAYEMGWSNLVQMAGELTLNTPPPAFLQQEDTPVLSSLETSENAVGAGTVCFSKGLVDLINAIAHAKALDDDKRGFLKAYVVSLSTNGSGPSVPSPRFTDPQKAWSADMVNTQKGYFNQIGGGLMAIQLACVQLGYHRNHAPPQGTSAKKPVPLIASLTAAEWHRALLTGVTNAIMIGYNTPGLVAFYQTLDQVKPKPAWMDYFLPPDARISKIVRELKNVEDDLLQKDNDLFRIRNFVH